MKTLEMKKDRDDAMNFSRLDSGTNRNTCDVLSSQVVQLLQAKNQLENNTWLRLSKERSSISITLDKKDKADFDGGVE